MQTGRKKKKNLLEHSANRRLKVTDFRTENDLNFVYINKINVASVTESRLNNGEFYNLFQKEFLERSDKLRKLNTQSALGIPLAIQSSRKVHHGDNGTALLSHDCLDDKIDFLDDKEDGSCILPYMKVYSEFDVYEKRLSTHPEYCEIPDCVYLIYISMHQEHSLEVRHYYYRSEREIMPGKQIKDIIDLMTLSIVEAKFEDIEPVLENMINTRQVNFENIHFSNKCYVALVVDDPNLRFHSNYRNQAAIKFLTLNDDGLVYQDNDSFFDAENFNVDVSFTDAGYYISGFYMINHCVTKNPEVAKEYKFDIFLDMLFTIGGAGSAEKTIVIDPTSKNGGPPPGGG